MSLAVGHMISNKSYYRCLAEIDIDGTHLKSIFLSFPKIVEIRSIKLWQLRESRTIE